MNKISTPNTEDKDNSEPVQVEPVIQPNSEPRPAENGSAVCKIGALTIMYLIFSVIAFCFQLKSYLIISPAKLTLLKMLLYGWFPFAINIEGLLVNVVILLFFSTFFEKKYGTLGFFFKLEFFKLMFVLLTWSFYKFFYFIHPTSIISNMLTLNNFSVLFMVLVSQEAFDRPNDFSIIPVINISFKNVAMYLLIN